MRRQHIAFSTPSSEATLVGRHRPALGITRASLSPGKFGFENPVFQALLGLDFAPKLEAKFGPRELDPLVTIGIPAYNRPELLAETLASIAAQTADVGVEVIVCDDGLLPETRAVVGRFSHLGYKYLPNAKRLGPVANWNQCFKMARGEWVMVLHEDDTLYPWYLDCVLPRLWRGAVAVCTRTENGAKAPDIRRPRTAAPVMDYVPRYFLKSSMSPFPGVLVRRDVATRLGGFDEEWGPIADYEFWYRLSCAGRIEVVGAVGAFYRVAPGQWTERIWKRMLRLTHLLRLRIAKEQFPESPSLGRWAARFFTFRNARCYAKRFGSGPTVLQRCIRMGSMRLAGLPSGWVWRALKFASRPNRGHSDRETDAGRAPQIQQSGRGPDRFAAQDPVGGPAGQPEAALAGAGGSDRHAQGKARYRDPHQGADYPRQVA